MPCFLRFSVVINFFFYAEVAVLKINRLTVILSSFPVYVYAFVFSSVFTSENAALAHGPSSGAELSQNQGQNQSLAQAPVAYPAEQSQSVYQPISQPMTQSPMQSPMQQGQPYSSERAMVAPMNSLPIPAGIVVTTTLNVDGYRIREYKGIVRGAMVREPTIGQSFKAGFQGMFGGKIGAYVTMCEQGRQQSYDTMVAKAQALGANAIVGVQYDSNSFSTDSNQFATEVVCYGTAVVIEPLR
jgi:uncharacterized protein YbjQ (UPF0145 family)